ncbi:MAG: hypothetical protein V8S14_03510 [Lachnospiraceae bacterium]
MNRKVLNLKSWGRIWERWRIVTDENGTAYSQEMSGNSYGYIRAKSVKIIKRFGIQVMDKVSRKCSLLHYLEDENTVKRYGYEKPRQRMAKRTPKEQWQS